MDTDQRRIVALAAYAVGLVLGFFYFLRPLWAWAMWDRSKGTLDLGFMQVTSRPPFPADARSVLVGLVLPILLVTAGRLVLGRRPR